MIWRWLAVLLAAVATAHGQMIEFAAPASGHTATLSDGRLGVQWRGDIEALAEYQLQLMAGGDTESQSGQVAAITGAQPLPGGEATVSLPVSLESGPAASNAYFLRLTAVREDGTSAVFYSGRFSIAGMTGGFPQSASGGSSADVGAAYQQVKSDVAAVPENKAGAAPALVLQGRQLAADGTPLPYAEQTAGVIRYAPMQQKPPTTITAVNTQPMYPTSDFNIATTALPIPTIISTQTQPITYKTSSAVNQATAAAPPQNDMAKYLARWRD